MKTYRISQLAKLCGLSRSTLLYYDRIGLLRPGGRSASRYRLYTAEDLARLERICLYREAGVNLADVARLLDDGEDGTPLLTERLQAIGREIAGLRNQQKLVTGMLRAVAAGPVASGLDRELWAGLRSAAGLDEAALRRWHAAFERRAPEAHHGFLLGLGLSEKEALQVRMLTRNVEVNEVSMKYFYELFEELPRQGPGSEAATRRALGRVRGLPPRPDVLDIGCGCGLPTRLLARELGTRVVAIDNHGPVLDRLAREAAREGLDIETRELSMLDLPFADGSFDLLWAEGSIFIIGLARGLVEFRKYLRPGGHLAFTEMCWFTDEPPAEAKAYLDSVYPDIRSADAVRRLAGASGYEVVDSFDLPSSAWWDEYYTPMLERMAVLRQRHAGIAEAEAVYAACEVEAEMFRRHGASYGYTFFVLRKP